MSKKWLCGFIELAVVLAKPIMRFVSLSLCFIFKGGGEISLGVCGYMHMCQKRL